MLSDFLTLEVYFGDHNAALYFEDLVKKYGKTRIQKAVERGDIHCRTIMDGPDRGRVLAWLSQQGRNEASAGLTSAL